MTAKALAEPTPASGLVTITVRAPVLADASTEIVAFSSVELVKLVDSTVTPDPKDAVAPLTKLVPLIAMTCLAAPWPRELGFVEVTVGAPLTVKAFSFEPTPSSGLVTVTLRAPVVAPDSIVIFAVSSVALTNVVELTVTPVPKDALAPVMKLSPLIATVSVPPCRRRTRSCEMTKLTEDEAIRLLRETFADKESLVYRLPSLTRAKRPKTGLRAAPPLGRLRSSTAEKLQKS